MVKGRRMIALTRKTRKLTMNLGCGSWPQPRFVRANALSGSKANSATTMMHRNYAETDR
jgi:hypothetical protein